jgi:hypothetical protein
MALYMFKPTARQRQIRRETERRQRRFIRLIGEGRLYWAVGLLVKYQVSEEIREYPILVLVPLAIIAYGVYKKYFPTESLYHGAPDSEERPDAKGETQSDAPSDELKSALGAEADELLQVENRLLDQLAASGVTGSVLADTARNFSSTRFQLTANTKPERRKSARGRHQPENPQTE